MSDRNIAVFILTHGRADNVKTYKTLRDCGYTGKIYLVIDDEDDQEQRYRHRYGDQVVQFCKEQYLQNSMCINPDKPRKVILYARNACFDIARRFQVTHFVEMDDDYTRFEFRTVAGQRLLTTKVKNMDMVMQAFFDFLESTHIKTCAFAQGGDFIGGASAWHQVNMKRKAMNSFFCVTDNPVNFIGAINEDVNTYVTRGNVGELFFTIGRIDLVQTRTQKSSGGMSEVYLDMGTYAKSFPTVMLNPSCVKIAIMGSTNKRIHHEISWKNAVPRIINEKYKKQKA